MYHYIIMSDTEDTLVASAQALVDTYSNIASPTLEDLNTLTSGIALILNKKKVLTNLFSLTQQSHL